MREAPHEAEMVFTARCPVVAFQMNRALWQEHKVKWAAVMVGILISVLVLCWSPFFLTELISPLCACSLPPIWKSVFLWLGYSNSFFNPDLHGIEQELQQCLQETFHQAEINPGLGEMHR